MKRISKSSRIIATLLIAMTLLTVSCDLGTPPRPIRDNPWDPGNPNAVPEVLSIETITGNIFTNSLSNTFQIRAKAASSIRFSEVPDSGAALTSDWQPADSTSTTTVFSIRFNTGGDGWRWIAAQCRADNQRVSVVKYYRLGLDTRVAIASFTCNTTGGDTLFLGDTVIFNMHTADDFLGSETGGIASVMVEGWNSMPLTQQAEGAYTGNYTIQTETPIVGNAEVSVSFTDRAGNVTPIIVAERRLTVGVNFELFRTLTGHSSMVNSVAFSPYGTLLASGSYDHSIKIWYVTDGAEVRTLTGHLYSVPSVVFSPDGLLLASGSFQETRIWNVSSGSLVRVLTDPHWDQSVAFSPDGLLLASGGGEGIIKIRRISDGSEVRSLNGHSSAIFSVAFSPDGSMLASGSQDSTIKLWQVSDGNLLHTLTGHSSGLSSVVFSPDGQILASGSGGGGADNIINLWRVSNGALIRTLTGHSLGISSIAFSPDGFLLASGSYDDNIKLWHVSDGAEVLTVTTNSVVLSVSFSPDGSILASGSRDGTINLWRRR